MNRRQFLKTASIKLPLASAAALGLVETAMPDAAPAQAAAFGETPRGRKWLSTWEKGILSEAHSRYCDKEMGEELGWLVSPFLNGFYYGYLATRDSRWVERLVDWADACLRRAVREPDGFLGWPKGNGGGGRSSVFIADSLLGEAMMLRPVVLMAGQIRQTPGLKSQWGRKADKYLEVAQEIFRKWDSRDCWREVKDGGVWVAPPFGIDRRTGKWSEGFEKRKTEGFTHPANKENLIARWLAALHDVTGKPLYLHRATKWWRVMKSRLRTREDGKFLVWNYWDPAGPWDYKPDGSPRHWVGVHPNGGYYAIDVESMVTAYDRDRVFDKQILDRLIATNRDFMWNHRIQGAKFRRIDGGAPDPRWKRTPGVLWTALVPHDPTLRKIFLANHQPASWGGLSSTPWFLSLDD